MKITKQLVGLLIMGTAASAAANDVPVIDWQSNQWHYYRAVAAPDSTWQQQVQSQWSRGHAPFGFGKNTGNVNTWLPNVNPARPPLASYFTHTFSLEQVPQEGVKLTTWVDDGLIIYINGREAFRQNLPAGSITHDATWATQAPDSVSARAALRTIVVPAALLREGTNIVAAQLQSNWRSTHNLTFDARITRSDAGWVEAWGYPTWRDEFDYVDPASGRPAINPRKWNVRSRADMGLLFDVAIPDAGQVSVNKGIVNLRGEWLDSIVQRPPSQNGKPPLTHKTGYMDHRALKDGNMHYSQRYGRWEMRAKLPTGPNTYGSLAAFWLRNSQSGEIDIVEGWGYRDAAHAPSQQPVDTAVTTVHTYTADPNLNKKYIFQHDKLGAAKPVWNDFHTYAFEYTPDYAAIFFDGKLLKYIKPSDYPNLWDPNYFGTPLHVRLNLHIGPSAKYWGLPDWNNKSWTQNLNFEVDYVRIWKYPDPE